ncbi:ATP-binding protein [Paucibacter sp. AS339]|uniref:sensor histidine kinase n=1 Tax=Paucibacter hankyongi TaxID=3133434 RepID=UPI0030AA4C43
MRLWPQRFKHQLGLMFALLLLLALGLLGGFTAWQQTARGRDSVEAQAQMLAASLGASSTNLVVTDSLDALEAQALAYAGLANVRQITLLDTKARSLTQVQRLPGQAPAAVFNSALSDIPAPAQAAAHTQTSPDGSRLIAWHPLQSGDQLLAWVRVDYDLTEQQQQARAIWRNTAFVAIAAIALCYGLLMSFLRRPLACLDEARLFAVELSDDLGRAPMELQGPLEFVQLQRALNETSVLLQQHLILLQDSMETHQAQSRQLAAQNDQLGAIFANSPDGLLTFNRAGKVEFANQAFLRLADLREDEVLGQDDLGLDAKLRERALDASEFAGLAASFGPAKQVLTLRGDRPRVLAISGRQTTASAVSLVLYVRDETQQHELDRMKSEFLSLAAHELRTPMASIFGFVELLINREFSDAKRIDLLNRIHRQSKLMINILNELLDLARIEARGAADFKFEPFELSELVADAIKDFNPPAGREPPQVTLPSYAMPVTVDRQKMQQVLINTLSNAYKYSPGGEAVSIGFRVDEPPEGRRHFGVEVRDRGVGLSPEHLARMGERFFRADTSGHIPGTGLGVSLVKELLDLMGGRLQIDSELGQGTCVTLWL